MKRNILVLVMLAFSMVGLTACQTKNDQTVQSSETVLSEETQASDEASAEMSVTGNALDRTIITLGRFWNAQNRPQSSHHLSASLCGA